MSKRGLTYLLKYRARYVINELPSYLKQYAILLTLGGGEKKRTSWCCRTWGWRDWDLAEKDAMTWPFVLVNNEGTPRWFGTPRPQKSHRHLDIRAPEGDPPEDWAIFSQPKNGPQHFRLLGNRIWNMVRKKKTACIPFQTTLRYI